MTDRQVIGIQATILLAEMPPRSMTDSEEGCIKLAVRLARAVAKEVNRMEFEDVKALKWQEVKR